MSRIPLFPLLLVVLSCQPAEPVATVQDEWREALAVKRSLHRNPGSIEARQAWADALSGFIDRYPDHDRAAQSYTALEMEMARELASRGRYSAAIPYYESILSRQPDHATAQQELTMLYQRMAVTSEQLSRLRHGMTSREVQEILGIPRPGWVRTVEKGGTRQETWFYRDAEGQLASVSFLNGEAFVAEHGDLIRLSR